MDPKQKPEVTYVEFDGKDDPLHPWNWPKKQRYLMTVIIALSTMTVSMASSIFTPAIPSIMAQHSISREVAILGVSLYVLGFATGPIIWASISEIKGRYLPFNTSMFGFTVFCFAAARSGHDLSALFICRYFSGFFGAGPLTLASAVFTDMYTPKNRTIMITFYSLAVFLGPLLSQPIGGFIVVNQSLGWTWTELLPGILGAAGFLGMVIFQRESYWPVILSNKAAQLRRETGDYSIIAQHDTVVLDARSIVDNYLLFPLRMLTQDPIVLCMCIFGSFVYGLLYLFLTAYPAVFEDVHDMSPGIAGLPYIGLILGQIINAIVSLLIQRYWLLPRIARNSGRVEPEWVLPIAIPGAGTFAGGLFWLGWSGYKRSIPWIVPTASGLLSGFGLLAMFLPSISYITLSRPQRAASGIAAHTFLRSLFGACFPLFATYMYTNMGIQWANTLLGCLAALMIPIPLLLYVYGPRIRQKVKVQY